MGMTLLCLVLIASPSETANDRVEPVVALVRLARGARRALALGRPFPAQRTVRQARARVSYLLMDPDVDVRLAGAMLARALGVDRKKLTASLRTDRRPPRRDAVRALLGTRRALDRLVARRCHDLFRANRSARALLLLSVSGRHTVRRALAGNLGRCRETPDLLCALRMVVRHRVAVQLMVLKKHLRHEFVEVRRAAASALGAVADKATIHAVTQDRSLDAEVRASVVRIGSGRPRTMEVRLDPASQSFVIWIWEFGDIALRFGVDRRHSDHWRRRREFSRIFETIAAHVSDTLCVRVGVRSFRYDPETDTATGTLVWRELRPSR